VRVHDFKIPELGKVAPYGVYDIAANHGWVSVGISADTGAFAVESIRRWWYKLGKPRYPNATCLTITADCGGSNGPQVKLWKRELQHLANETGLKITVAHLPPGTSKWIPNRTSAIRLRYHELARQAAGEPCVRKCPQRPVGTLELLGLSVVLMLDQGQLADAAV
jgi:Rhodopirellula transposase DDE domain